MTPLSYKNTCGTCLLGSGHVPITMGFSDVFGSEIACIGQYMKTHTVFKLLVVAGLRQDTAAESAHRQRHCQSWSRCRGFRLVGPLTLQFLQAHDTCTRLSTNCENHLCAMSFTSDRLLAPTRSQLSSEIPVLILRALHVSTPNERLTSCHISLSRYIH